LTAGNPELFFQEEFFVRGCPAAWILLLTAALTIPQAAASIGDEEAKTAALSFGRALTVGDTTRLEAILPDRGKIRLRLTGFGPAAGSYSADQVAAIFKSFLREGAVRSFDLLRLECASEHFAFVHARTRVIDRDGRTAGIDLHLTFQPEGDHWVLREIRETPP
jgi:hypothetical protein